MAYKALKLSSSTPARVKSLVRSLESHYFSDVHTMLRLPLPNHELTAGCNFAIAQVLAATVSGISVTLYSQDGHKGARFKGVLRDYYPWSLEPGNFVQNDEGARVLYELIRNPLIHDLGLDLDKKRKAHKVIVKRLASTPGGGLSEQFIEALESRSRPSPISPTVSIQGARTVVLVEALYWGVRQMIEKLTTDPGRMKNAEALLASV